MAWNYPATRGISGVNIVVGMHAGFFGGASDGLVIFTQANAEFVHEKGLLFAVTTELGALSGGSSGRDKGVDHIGNKRRMFTAVIASVWALVEDIRGIAVKYRGGVGSSCLGGTGP